MILDAKTPPYIRFKNAMNDYLLSTLGISFDDIKGYYKLQAFGKEINFHIMPIDITLGIENNCIPLSIFINSIA